MNRSIIIGLVLAALAAGATTVAITATADNPQEPHKQPADQALRPDQLTKIPAGTTLPSSVDTPVSWGRFRVVPFGGVPSTCPEAPAPVGASIERSEGVRPTDIKGNALAINPYVPAGWEATETRSVVRVLPSGVREPLSFEVAFAQPRHFGITFVQSTFPEPCVQDLIGFETGQDTYTLTTIKGWPAVIQHQAPGRGRQTILAVTVIHDGIITGVEGIAIDIDELIRMVESVLPEAK